MKKRRIAAILCILLGLLFGIVGICKYIEEKQAGEEYMELQKQAEKEEPDLQKPQPEKKEEKPSVQEKWEMAHKMFRELYELELLREDWDMLLMESEELLYSHGADAYKGISSDFKRWAKEESNIQIQAEQLLVYFIFTYFCGAVYDGRIYAKVQMAVISTFHIYELWKARWIKNEGELTPEEIVELVYRYSREIEHSDKNLERMEKMMLRDRLPWYRG